MWYDKIKLPGFTCRYCQHKDTVKGEPSPSAIGQDSDMFWDYFECPSCTVRFSDPIKFSSTQAEWSKKEVGEK